jgi:hypothetical protein
VHYALALLRTGSAADEQLRKRQVDTILALPSADLRIDLGGQHVMALFARGRVAEAEHLLGELFVDGGPQGQTGSIMRTLIPPIWGDDALGRYDEAAKLLVRLEELLRRPDMPPKDLRHAQWSLTALHGIVDAETGKVPEAREELRALSSVTTTETYHQVLVGELTGRIQLREGGPVSELPASAGLVLRVRAAHLAGRVAERDGNDGLAEQHYARLLEMASKCTDSELPAVLICAPWVASGLARLARIQHRLGRKGDVARTLRVFDAVWPSPDADLAPVKMAAEARGAAPLR